MRMLLLAMIVAAPLRAGEPVFAVHCIDPDTTSEGLTVLDVNGDGRLDITCGQYWYEQPAAAWSKKTSEKKKFNPRYLARFVGNKRPTDNPGCAAYAWKKHRFRLVAPQNPPDKQTFSNGWYDNNYGEFLSDVNRDGRPDIVTGGWFAPGVFWFENPGPRGLPPPPRRRPGGRSPRGEGHGRDHAPRAEHQFLPVGRKQFCRASRQGGPLRMPPAP